MCRYVGNVPVSVGSPLRPELLDPLMGVRAPGFPDVGKLRALSADTLLSWVLFPYKSATFQCLPLSPQIWSFCFQEMDLITATDLLLYPGKALHHSVPLFLKPGLC